MVWIDVGSIDVVRNDAAITRVNTGYHSRAVYHRGTGINGMMIPKSDALARELPKSRSILLGHKIRTHPVPHDNHYMPPWFSRHDGGSGKQQKHQCNHKRKSGGLESAVSAAVDTVATV